MSVLASRVDAAVAGLPADEQQVLAMREREGAAYRAIADRVGGGREGVADLLVSARLAIWSDMHGEPVPARRTSSCGPARRVLAAQADGEAVSGADADRAREHLASCAPCAEARLALREAELACRAWRTNRAGSVPVATNPVPSVPQSGTDLPRFPLRGTDVTRYARRRLIAAAVAVLLLIVVLAVAFGGSDPAPTPAAPKTGPGSAQGSGNDVVPPPGEKFCPDNRTNCK